MRYISRSSVAGPVFQHHLPAQFAIIKLDNLKWFTVAQVALAWSLEQDVVLSTLATVWLSHWWLAVVFTQNLPGPLWLHDLF